MRKTIYGKLVMGFILVFIISNIFASLLKDGRILTLRAKEHKNILTLNQIDNQNIPTLKEEFSLDEQIRKSILLLERKWFEKDIQLEIGLEKALYRGNPGLMYQV